MPWSFEFLRLTQVSGNLDPKNAQYFTTSFSGIQILDRVVSYCPAEFCRSQKDFTDIRRVPQCDKKTVQASEALGGEQTDPAGTRRVLQAAAGWGPCSSSGSSYGRTSFCAGANRSVRFTLSRKRKRFMSTRTVTRSFVGALHVMLRWVKAPDSGKEKWEASIRTCSVLM